MLETPVKPDWEGLVSCIRRQGTPARVHTIELFLDYEVKVAIAERFGLLDGLDADDPYRAEKAEIRIQRFLGYDYVRCAVEGLDWPFHRGATEDTAATTAGIARQGGRSYMDEHTGPITTWEEFDAYPWPDPARASTRSLEWYERNLPDDMCVVASGGFAHFAEHLVWLPGYETLCYLLYDRRDLVRAIADRLVDIYRTSLERILQFHRVELVWGSDDMGFRGGTLIRPDDLREFVLPGHRLMAEMSHAAGKPYLLHSCGNLLAIMEDLLEDVRIDGRHSFEDVIEPVVEARARWGDRVALLGGMDVDFLCRADEAAVRRRVRETLDACMEGGGYCLGSGNSVANYIPVDNYLAMQDEGRRWRP